MEKKELAEPLLSDIKPPSASKLKEFFLTFLKLLIGILLLPIVYAVTVAFIEQLLKLEIQVTQWLVCGIASFLGIYLFVWEPAVLFKKGQRILEIVFRFFAPLVKAAPYVLPIYGILIFIVYLILLIFMDMRDILAWFIWGLGFSFALHIVFCAKTLRSKQGDSLKAGYIFGFSLIYILDALFLAMFFNVMFAEFSFLSFFNGSCQIVKTIYTAAFGQLFL